MAFAPFDITGKVALVTGGNGGIGLGFAKGIAAAGGNVVIWGTNESKNAAALAELETFGTQVAAMQCDVSDSAQVESCFDSVLADFGRVDGCFANAGIPGGGPHFDELPEEDWRRMMSVNLDGVYYTFKTAASHMRTRAEAGDPGGRLVGTTSLSAWSGAPRSVHYASTKGAMNSMIRSLAVGYARWSITAHTIMPGWVDTAMTEGSFNNDRFVDNVLKRVPMRRWGVPEDFSGLAVYIMSDASSYHTGENFLIDGGYWLF
ncbi:MAG: SDR family oxidoreductase [Pseudomonadota bacterium]|nr:SDR family oxidoreductase [Pseudomonadota bacterium]